MFRVMPFGLTGAPASCMRVMGKIFHNLERRIGFIYMDDLICFAKGVEEHVRRLLYLADRCRKYGLKMRADKCTFVYPSVAYLGHRISGEGISPDLERHKDLLTKPKPTTVKELQSFLGFTNFFRTFIVNFAEKTFPLTKLLRKSTPWAWSEEQEKAYKQLLSDLTNPPVLAHYDPDCELEIRVDASDEGLGCVLVQINKEGERQILAAHSRTYQPYEENYGITHKECLGILFGIRQARPFVFGRRFTVVTDHCCLCYLMKAQDLSSRLARWSLELADYDFQLVYNSGPVHGDADYMSRRIKNCNMIHKGVIPSDQMNDMCFPIDTGYRSFLNQYNIEWNPDKTRNEQNTDPILGIILRNLKKQEPVGNRERLKLENNYEIDNDILFRRLKISGHPVSRLALPKSMIMDVLYFCHDTPTAGHFGFLKTLWKLKYVHWPFMNEDIYGYVKSCKECQFRKPPYQRPFGPQLKLDPIADNVMKSISIDIVGPLTQTNNDNKYVLTITDQLSKFAVAVPLFETKDADIMEALERHVFYRYGPPKVLLSDKGRNLCSKNCERFYEDWGITHVTTTPYHPQSNGQVEKFNGTLAIMLATQIKRNDETWDEFVEDVVLAYNSTPSSSTWFTPFYLMFGKQIDPPQMIRLGCRSAETAQGEDVIKDRKIAIERIKKLQLKNEEIANRRRQVSNFKNGDVVLLLSLPLQTQRSAKLHPHYIGPFKIIRQIRDNVFEIEAQEGRKTVKIVNVLHMKRYFPRENFTLRCERQVQVHVLTGHNHESKDIILSLSKWTECLHMPEIIVDDQEGDQEVEDESTHLGDNDSERDSPNNRKNKKRNCFEDDE